MWNALHGVDDTSVTSRHWGFLATANFTPRRLAPSSDALAQPMDLCIASRIGSTGIFMQRYANTRTILRRSLRANAATANPNPTVTRSHVWWKPSPGRTAKHRPIPSHRSSRLHIPRAKYVCVSVMSFDRGHCVGSVVAAGHHRAECVDVHDEKQLPVLHERSGPHPEIPQSRSQKLGLGRQHGSRETNCGRDDAVSQRKH